jgi:hypothetical protein
MVTLARVIVMNIPGVVPSPDPGFDLGPPVVRHTPSTAVRQSIPGPVIDWSWSDHTHFLRLARTKVELDNTGWYVWGSVSDRSGHILLAATRTGATSSTAFESNVPAWEYDFLRWPNGGLVSIGHHASVVPSLVLCQPGPSYHVSDGDAFGLVQGRSSKVRLPTLLVETPDGHQSYLNVSESGS